MNGREQVKAYAQLWQPDELAGFKIGDLVDCPTLGRCEVVELIPPSLLKVRTASGAEAKVGWRVANRVNQGNIAKPGTFI